MNKSEVELANCEAIIAQMPSGEQEMCRRMIDSLLASVGHPIHGRVFMIAVAHVNCNVAVTSIRLGLVDAKGEPTARYPETKREENAALRQIGTEAGNVPRETKRKAPWPDFEGNALYEGDTIIHPVSKETGVIYVVEEQDHHAAWRVQYDGHANALFMQIGDKGQAVKYTPGEEECEHGVILASEECEDCNEEARRDEDSLRQDYEADLLPPRY